MSETASPRLGPRHRADTSVRASGGPPPFRRGRAPAWETRECPRPTLGVPLFARPAARRTAATAAVVAFLGPLALTLCAPAAHPGPTPAAAAAAPPLDVDQPADRALLMRADRANRPTSLYPAGRPTPPATPAPVSSAAPPPAGQPTVKASTTTSAPAPRRTTTSTPRKRTTTEAAQAPAATGDIAVVLAYARAQVGKPYVYGAAGPNAFDCSGLVMAAYARIGIHLPHKAESLFSVGRPVARGDIRPGDVLVLEGGGHTAIALGGGLMIHASRAGQPVAIVKIYANPNAVRRLVG